MGVSNQTWYLLVSHLVTAFLVIAILVGLLLFREPTLTLGDLAPSWIIAFVIQLLFSFVIGISDSYVERMISVRSRIFVTPLLTTVLVWVGITFHNAISIGLGQYAFFSAAQFLLFMLCLIVSVVVGYLADRFESRIHKSKLRKSLNL